MSTSHAEQAILDMGDFYSASYKFGMELDDEHKREEGLMLQHEHFREDVQLAEPYIYDPIDDEEYLINLIRMADDSFVLVIDDHSVAANKSEGYQLEGLLGGTKMPTLHHGDFPRELLEDWRAKHG